MDLKEVLTTITAGESESSTLYKNELKGLGFKRLDIGSEAEVFHRLGDDFVVKVVTTPHSMCCLEYTDQINVTEGRHLFAETYAKCMGSFAVTIQRRAKMFDLNRDNYAEYVALTGLLYEAGVEDLGTYNVGFINGEIVAVDWHIGEAGMKLFSD